MLPHFMPPTVYEIVSSYHLYARRSLPVLLCGVAGVDWLADSISSKETS